MRATTSVPLAEASKNLVVIAVPSEHLKDGVNRIAIEEHANYGGAASVTFDLKARMVR